MSLRKDNIMTSFHDDNLREDSPRSDLLTLRPRNALSIFEPNFSIFNLQGAYSSQQNVYSKKRAMIDAKDQILKEMSDEKMIIGFWKSLL